MTTVQDLIEWLQTQPPNARVVIPHENQGYCDIDLRNFKGNIDLAIDYWDGWDGPHEPAYEMLKKSGKQWDNYHITRSFTAPHVYPSIGGSWAWSPAQNRWVRIDPPEPPKPEPLKLNIEPGVILK